MENDKPKTSINVKGDLEGNIIVGDGNNILVQKESKVASELALQRLEKERKILSDKFWDILYDDVNQDKGLLSSITGKYKPRLSWTFIAMLNMPYFKDRLAKYNTWKGYDDKDRYEVFTKLHPTDIEEIIEFAPSFWKGRELDGVLDFSNQILEIKIKMVACNEEIKKHKEILKS